MKRRYNADMASAAIRRMREAMPDVTFSCDVIVGFPGETEEDFAQTMEFCRNARFLHMHIFPYSKRAGTVAAERKDQVPENVKHDRLVRLETLGKEIKRELLDDYVEKHRETPVYVLVEKSENGTAVGHSEHYYEVNIPDCAAEAGNILAVYPDVHDGEIVTGHIQ
jgi:threonylcarbamoyladenosine tRNA methylthiotransferase MtaB